MTLILFGSQEAARSAAYSPSGQDRDEQQRKRTERQLRDIEKARVAVAATPESAEAHFILAKAMTKGPQTAESPKQIAEEYLKAISLKPDYAEAYCGLGSAYGDMGEYDKEREAFNKAISLKPEYADSYLGLAGTYLFEKQYRNFVKVPKTEEDIRGGIEMLKRALSVKPDLAEAHVLLGIAYNGLGQKDEAIESYRQAINLDAKDLYSRMTLANLYIDLGNKDGALKEYDAFVQLGASVCIGCGRPSPTSERTGSYDEMEPEQFQKAARDAADMLLKRIKERFGDK